MTADTLICGRRTDNYLLRVGRTSMACFHRMLNVVVWASLASVASAEQVREIPGNWQTPDLRRITVVNAAASSALTPEGEQYAPARAIDGQRGTKWGASVDLP